MLLLFFTKTRSDDLRGYSGDVGKSKAIVQSDRKENPLDVRLPTTGTLVGVQRDTRRRRTLPNIPLDFKKTDRV